MDSGKRRSVGILIFDVVEVLDFCGPFEVFALTRRVGERDEEARFSRALG
jgi:hypothetical protein